MATCEPVLLRDKLPWLRGDRLFWSEVGRAGAAMRLELIKSLEVISLTWLTTLLDVLEVVLMEQDLQKNQKEVELSCEVTHERVSSWLDPWNFWRVWGASWCRGLCSVLLWIYVLWLW